MANVNGHLAAIDLCSHGDLSGKVGHDIVLKSGPAGTVVHFRMRAWDTLLAAWEFWSSINTVDPSPPSGHPITGLSVVARWEV